MSHEANVIHTSNLIDEAMDYIEGGDLSSTPLETILRNDINRDDMEALENHLIEARELLREE